jgi:hypothetical protein
MLVLCILIEIILNSFLFSDIFRNFAGKLSKLAYDGLIKCTL